MSDELAPKEVFVAEMLTEFGGTAEKWAADWERIRVEIAASKQKGK